MFGLKKNMSMVCDTYFIEKDLVRLATHSWSCKKCFPQMCKKPERIHISKTSVIMNIWRLVVKTGCSGLCGRNREINEVKFFGGINDAKFGKSSKTLQVWWNRDD